ncbi:MAG: DUF4260 domain-containing protein [Rhizobiaceae bacterium]|nr:DUF4260 domain-containing protein [Rhizobiaceae bacterium]
MTTTNPGAAVGAPRLILRAEGAAAAAAGLWLFMQGGQSWWLFAILLFAPDLAFAAYLAGARAGAVAYNIVHSTLGPLLLAAAAWWFGSDLALALAGIWLTHVGMDRALGYGLKYPTAFQDTHLGRIGRDS